MGAQLKSHGGLDIFLFSLLKAKTYMLLHFKRLFLGNKQAK